jgi:hypothetical protein
MSGRAEDPEHEGALLRVARRAVTAATTLLVAAVLLVTSALVVYTAWIHDLKDGIFAVLFAALSAQIALNWLRWQRDEGPPDKSA